MKRIICMKVDEPVVMINPELVFPDEGVMEVWDDCLCFPDLMVKVLRRRRCHVTFNDETAREHKLELSDDLAELIQHEYDHLDGILATMRAVNARAFALRSQIQRTG